MGSSWVYPLCGALDKARACTLLHADDLTLEMERHAVLAARLEAMVLQNWSGGVDAAVPMRSVV